MAERRRQSKASSSRSRTRGFAPSGDLDSMEKMEASKEAQEITPSDTDAMGQDKRRQVVGHAYGPSRKSQVVFFVIIAAIAVIAIGGFALAVAAFDQPADDYADKAPWSAADAKQIPTRNPAGPCGEPGNPYPPPEDSPCAPGGVGDEAADQKLANEPDQEAVEQSGATGAQ